MNFIKGENRTEPMLLPESLDDYIPEDHYVRFVEEFVESLDLEVSGFQFPKNIKTGRPSYHPKTLLKLFIYGYLNGIRSGRKLEKAAQINIEVMWLLQKLKPDFKTICDFRKNNAEAFRQVTSTFTQICHGMKFIKGKVVAIDGSKFKGVNSNDNNVSQTKIDNYIKRLEVNIDRYLKELDETLESETQEYNATKEKLGKALKKKEQLTELKASLKASKQTQISYTDPDTRRMTKNGKTVVGYNVQSVVDSEHKLIISSVATNDVSDIKQLGNMTAKAKQILDEEEIHVLADRGYYSGKELAKCEELNCHPYVNEPLNSPSERSGLYGKKSFIYNEETDTYTCPNDQTLYPQKHKHVTKRKAQSYRNIKACRGCSLREKCTIAAYRSVNHGAYHPEYERVKQRIKEQPELLAKRGSIVEHPFGNIKRDILIGGFLVKGLRMVNAELSLAELAYNMKRVFKIMGKSPSNFVYFVHSVLKIRHLRKIIKLRVQKVNFWSNESYNVYIENHAA